MDSGFQFDTSFKLLPLADAGRRTVEIALALGDKVPRIFIKRDDHTGPGFGGNKVRKLDAVLSKAEADGADSVFHTAKAAIEH